MTKARKGSAFERSICVELSKWWTDGARSDIFWRTSGSGARATTRGKLGSKTANSHGDIMALDPIGQPFLDVFTVEAKRGFSRFTIADLLDKPGDASKQKYEGWIEQAIASQQAAGSLYWLLVVKRDQRAPLIFMHYYAWYDLKKICLFRKPKTLLILHLELNGKETVIMAMKLTDFLSTIKPAWICQLAKEA